MAMAYQYNTNAITLCVLTFALLLLPNPAITQPDFLSPLLSPVIGSFCKNIGCGRGKCKMSQHNDLSYECECDPGWKQTPSSNSSHQLKFLPCVFPNCTLNYSCSEVSPSPQPHQTPSNTSAFEPCQWANCGGGVCNKTSELTYACHCKEGYSNLFNNTAFPCFNECSIGGDCPNLGLNLVNRSTAAAPPSLADRGANQDKGNSLKQEVTSFWIIMLSLLIAALALEVSDSYHLIWHKFCVVDLQHHWHLATE